MKKKKLCVWFAACLFAAFAIWTALVLTVDVRPIGPEGSRVGFAAINRAVHNRVGVNRTLYTITDRLGMSSLLFVPGFGLLGLAQWCRRKSLKKVDRSLLSLGGVYLGLMVFFVFFECFPVNYRPILIEGRLEASYPSSTTLLALSVLPTAAMQFHARIQNGRLRWCVVLLLVLLTVFLVVGRILSGVHWITDVIGGILLSGGLVTLYWVGQE